MQFITVQRIKTLYDSFSYGQFSSCSPYINIWLLNRSSRTLISVTVMITNVYSASPNTPLPLSVITRAIVGK